MLSSFVSRSHFLSGLPVVSQLRAPLPGGLLPPVAVGAAGETHHSKSASVTRRQAASIPQEVSRQAELETVHTQLLCGTREQLIDASLCRACLSRVRLPSLLLALIGWLFVRSIKVEEKVSPLPALAADKKRAEEEEEGKSFARMPWCFHMCNCKSSVALTWIVV